MWKRWTIGTIVVLVTGLAMAWWSGWFSSNAAVAEVQQLEEKMADPALKDADRQALREQIRSKMEGLSPDARRAVFDARREAFEKRFESHIDQLLAMSPAERAKALDADIDQMEKRAADAAKRQQADAAAGKGQPSGARNQKGKGQRNAVVSDEQRVNRLRSRLDRGTPESRAKRAEYTRLINDRRKQRNLPPMTGRGPR